MCEQQLVKSRLRVNAASVSARKNLVTVCVWLSSGWDLRLSADKVADHEQVTGSKEGLMWLYLYQQSKKLSESVSRSKRGLIRHKQVPPTQAHVNMCLVQGKHMLVAGFCRLCPLSAESVSASAAVAVSRRCVHACHRRRVGPAANPAQKGRTAEGRAPRNQPCMSNVASEHALKNI